MLQLVCICCYSSTTRHFNTPRMFSRCGPDVLMTAQEAPKTLQEAARSARSSPSGRPEYRILRGKMSFFVDSIYFVRECSKTAFGCAHRRILTGQDGQDAPEMRQDKIFRPPTRLPDASRPAPGGLKMRSRGFRYSPGSRQTPYFTRVFSILMDLA